MPRILIIDDDQDMVEVMSLILGSRNYEVFTAASGEQGLMKAREYRPDLIILDVMMETADKGFEVARALKRDDELRDIPIMLLTAVQERTGFDFKPNAGDADWLPVEAYADKPIRSEDLLKKVRELIGE